MLGLNLADLLYVIGMIELLLFFFLFFFFGRDIHYKDAMKETTSVCEGHPQQKLQATRTT